MTTTMKSAIKIGLILLYMLSPWSARAECQFSDASPVKITIKGIRINVSNGSVTKVSCKIEPGSFYRTSDSLDISVGNLPSIGCPQLDGDMPVLGNGLHLTEVTNLGTPAPGQKLCGSALQDQNDPAFRYHTLITTDGAIPAVIKKEKGALTYQKFFGGDMFIGTMELKY